jgi:hypothetical protein
MTENCKIIEVPANLKPVMPLMNPTEAKAAWELYEKVKSALLNSTDYQAIAGKQYIKRSGFRKIAVAFGISDTILSEEKTNREDPEHSFVWRIKVGVSAPNGRSAVGVGACDSKERNFAHLEHDVYSTAHTRAKSRAISDLVAGGALSAEELADDENPCAPPINVTPQKPATESLWQQIPVGTKGPWEKTDDLSNDEVQAVIAEMDQAGKTMLEKNGYLYWQLLDKDILVGLGRRKKM